jgi:hypothetical protein
VGDLTRDNGWDGLQATSTATGPLIEAVSMAESVEVAALLGHELVL